MRRCLISYAKNGRERYEDALDRNKEQAIKFIDNDVDINYYKKILPEGVPEHSDVPYAFKPYLFKQMFDDGYEQVIWVDSTIMVVNDLNPMFDFLTKNGVLSFHNLGHPLKNWISDVALSELGITEEELKGIEQIMACVVGFDISNPVGKKVFDEWYLLAEKKEAFRNHSSNRNGFVAHRHDQACLSALLWKNKVKMLPYGNLVYEAHKDGYEGRKPYFLNKAI